MNLEPRRLVRSTLDALTAHIAILDHTGRVVMVNDAWRRFAEANDLRMGDHGVGANYLEICREAAADRCETAWQILKGFEDIRDGRLSQLELEYACHGPDERHWFVVRVIPLAGSSPTAFLVTHEAITARRLAESERTRYERRLRGLAAELGLTEERVRQRVAAELHDNILQNLGLCQMKLDRLHGSTPALRGPLDDLRSLVGESIDQARSLLHELSPPLLHRFGLIPAIEWLAQWAQRRFGFPCELRADRGPLPLGHDVEIVVFQAVRELLQNVGKHARASRARITIATEGERVRIQVDDDGVGFAPPSTAAARQRESGFGLRNMSERLDLLGGRLEIGSSPGEGTRAALLVPLRSES